MKLSTIINSLLLCVAAILFASSNKQTSVFIVGDSTAANKSHPETNPERGWGMALQGFFDSKIRVDNHALNGRSSKSFIGEGHWAKVLDLIKPGDYVIIQFGHNDEKKKADRYTEPGTTFDATLARYVTETREKGGIPVLMNSVVRRNFFRKSDNGIDDESLRNTVYTDEKINSDTLIDTHGAYLLSPRNVAKKMNVPFVDANKITHDYEQSLGIIGSRKLHMWFKPGEIASIPKGRQDNTHYNIYGADQVAHLLCKAICRELPELASHYQEYDVYVSRTGNGRYSDLQKAIENAPRDKKITIAITGGVWKKPKLSKRKNIELVLQRGAKFK